MTQSFQRSYPIFFAVCLAGILGLLPGLVKGQEDSVNAPGKDSFFLLKSRGLLGRLAKSITHDTSSVDNLQRIDVLYARYTGRIIRNIEVRNVDFGVPINDTLRSFKNTLTRMADAVHRTTRESVIRNNLFFKQYDTLLPILLADNERQLRDQPYIGDANIIVKRVLGTRDSVDIIVLTKDVLSLGGSFEMHSLTKVTSAIREDNFGGLGDKLQISGLFDQDRIRNVGYGAEYTSRNIGGSFADAAIGYSDFANTLNAQLREERTIYATLQKQLVNAYTRWIYSFDASWHKTIHLFQTDSAFLMDSRYQYYSIDAWAGLNLSTKQFRNVVKDDRLRTLLGLRILHQDFQTIPKKYDNTFFYQFANITGALASISLFRQDFYKTQYVYGFGRNEDVPQGLDVSITTGWTDKQNRVRPYTGLDLQLNYFSPKKNYFNYTLRFGGFNYKRKYEDVSILANLEYFSHLRQLSPRWKQRTFITVGLTTQFANVLNDPLLLESQYGLSEYQDRHLAGDHRLTVKAESVFFSPWTLLSFKFAPFIFGNASLLTPQNEPLDQTKLYNTIGAGIRSRNESLVFGTFELRAYYFPGKNFDGKSFRVDFNTGIKFKYNNQLIRRPEFIVVN
ncbi:MAG: hypothetical protein ABI415_02165 [Flavitalea sp.]